MSKNCISASIIAAGLFIWLASGLFLGESAPGEHASLSAQAASGVGYVSGDKTAVRAEYVTSESRARFLVLRGRTASKRSVQVKAEIAGKVTVRPVERGMRVAVGDLLCELAVDDRDIAVTEARAALAEAKIEHQGSLRLKEQGLQSQTAIARSAARLEAARTQVRRQQLNLERTRIVAPFGGLVEELHLNTGDFATAGAACVTLIDLDPMLIRADVTETEVENFQVGDRVSGRTSAGQEIEGDVSFIGAQSDPATRTYPVEITVDNADYGIRSGLTVSVRIDLGEVQAHQLSPALFTLSDEGELGVRTLDDSERVVFTAVGIIEDGPGGVWVTGLPDDTRLITVGQEFVSEGEQVEVAYTNERSVQVAQP